MFYIFHFYLWPLPIKWNSEYTVLSFVNPVAKALPFGVFILLMFLFGVVNFATIIYFSFLNNSAGFQRVNSVMLMLVGGCFVGMSSIVVIAQPYITATLITFRDLLQLAEQFKKGKSQLFLKI